MPALRYLKDVVSLKANPELCLGCGLCVQVCPQGVLASWTSGWWWPTATPAWSAGPA